MEFDTSNKTPLLSRPSHVDEVDPNDFTDNSKQDSISPELQFYDPGVVLDISKDVALGYLILLTGGNHEFITSTNHENAEAKHEEAEDNMQAEETSRVHVNHTEHKALSQSRLVLQNLDEFGSLAHAAIVDGNVLHTCFGLKPIPNGRISTTADDILGKKQRSSLLCCFPTASSSSLQIILPYKNKKQMMNLVEILREVKELEYEAGLSLDAASTNATKTSPLCIQVVYAYVYFFTSVVRYHESRAILCNSKRGCDSVAVEQGKCSNMRSNLCNCPSLFSSLKNLFFLTKTPEPDPDIIKLQNDTLKDINERFNHLRLLILERLEKIETETGLSVDES